MAGHRPIRLPKQWPKHVKAGVLHAISCVRGRATGQRRLRAQLEQATSEIALLREELSIKDDRWERSRSRRRPHYTPTQRMRILQLRAARGWTLEKTARVFLMDLQTLQIWMRVESQQHVAVFLEARRCRRILFAEALEEEIKRLAGGA